MAIINLYPDAILESTGFASGAVVGNIDESPSSPDALWAVTTAGANSVMRVSFPTPTQPSYLTTTTNSQTFNVRVRSTQSGATTIFAQIHLYKNGVLVSSGTNTNITNTTGQTLTYTWTPTANDDGSSIECRVTTTSDTSGSATAKGQADIGAIEWVANYTPYVELPTDVKMLIPTDRFPFDDSAWRRPEIKAKVQTTDNSSARLVVEYGTTVSLGTKKTSALVSSGTILTVTLDGLTFADGAEIYWRVSIENGTVRSDYSTTFNFTHKPNSTSFAPDGTTFMQQGNPATMIKFIDVSQYQGAVNFTNMKNAGINHMYFRAYGASRTDNNGLGDTNFESFVTNSRAVGIKSGAYFYCMPSVPLDLAQARAEADLFIAKLQAGYGTGQYGDLLPILDLEDNTGVAVAGQGIMNLSVEDMLQWAKEFREYFETTTGRRLGLYAGDYFIRDLRNNFNHNDATGLPVNGTSGNILIDMPLWIQGYTKYDRYKGYTMPSSGGWTKWYAFQYSEDGNTGGITPIDENLAENMDYWMPPSNVTGVQATDNGTDIVITWNANTEVDIHGYNVYLDNVWHGYVTGKNNTTYTFTNPTKNVQHTVGVRANDIFEDLSLNQTSITYTVVGENGVAPKVTIVSVDRSKISDEEGVDRVHITFKFDMDTKSYTVNVNGVDWQTGTVAHSGGGQTVGSLAVDTVGNLATKTVQQISIVVAGMEIIAEVDWTELSLGENRVNIYGQATDGTWSTYNQEMAEEFNIFGIKSYGQGTYGK